MEYRLRYLPALVLAAVLAPDPARAEAPEVEMRVEEPAEPVSPPIDPVLDSRPWKADRGALNRKEKAAHEQRRRQVEAMALHVREARQALEKAGGKEREDRARELERLLLDHAADDDAWKLKQLEKLLEASAEAKEKQVEKTLEIQEKKAEQTGKQMERLLERQEKQLEKKEKQLEQTEQQLEKARENQEKAEEKQKKLQEKKEKGKAKG